MPSHSHSFTPSGTVGSHSHSFKPEGTVSSHTHGFKPDGTVGSHNHTFTGTAASHSHDLLVYTGGKYNISNVYGNSLPASNVSTGNSYAYKSVPEYGGASSSTYISSKSLTPAGTIGST